MANAEQLSILKQGVDVWNKWREENPDIKINLRGANLGMANLKEAFLSRADLDGALLFRADLEGAVLHRAHLQKANLTAARLDGADCSVADLLDADLNGSKCINTKFYRVSLSGTQFKKADLTAADLTGAMLYDTNFSKTNLKHSRFSSAKIGSTNFENVDLGEVAGLDDVIHSGPSTIGMDTIARSKGKIPDVFLRGCGLSDWAIEYAKLWNPELSNEEINGILYKVYDLRAGQAIQISPLFISYSRKDGEFVDKVGHRFFEKGIRYWRDIHDMKAGRMERQIDRAIRQNSTVLLILSEHSLQSDWVEHEVRTARALEKAMERDVLCPVALDDSWKDSRWPKHIMEQIMEYNILDFSDWKDDSRFNDMFRKLIDGLELFYKG